jgi:UDP-glucose-4-epimerase GalE
MSRNILVTGGAGYIGSHACKELKKQGLLPVAFDNLSRGYSDAVKWGPLRVGDLADKDAILRAIEDFHIDGVLHFAAFSYVEESVVKPSLYFRNNIAGSINLLEAMTELGVNDLVFSSTCAVYGTPRINPISEDTPTEPINPYGESKLQVERMLRWYEQRHGLRWIALRYFNAAGADSDGEIGECHQPETHLLPLAIQAALGLAPPLNVRGSDYPTPDGTAIRDYVHVSDLAEAHVLAIKYLEKGGTPGAFNLGTGKGHSINQVIEEIQRCSNRSVPFSYAKRRDGDPPMLLCNPARAQKILGWKPRHSDLPNIIRTALMWEQRPAYRDVAE